MVFSSPSSCQRGGRGGAGYKTEHTTARLDAYWKIWLQLIEPYKEDFFVNNIFNKGFTKKLKKIKKTIKSSEKI